MLSFPITASDESPFPIENIPLGIFSTEGKGSRAGTRIGDYVLDLAVLEEKGLFAQLSDSFGSIFSQDALNAFASMPREVRSSVREKIIELLSTERSSLYTDSELNKLAFVPISEVKMHLPMRIPEYTDFSCFEEHVTNCCKMSGMSLPDNFFHSPLAYNGRTSSIVLSGVDIPRPRGVYKNAEGKPEYQPTSRLDYELELGVFVSNPVPWGTTITADEASAEHVFGFVLMNDWSARDIQMYESTPVGPLNGKAFATSISPWVISPEALEPAATKPLKQEKNAVPAHLRHSDLSGKIYDIDCHVYIGRKGKEIKKVSTTNLMHSYFTVGQMLAHRASSGSGMSTGDMLGSGTISSPAEYQINAAVAHNGCLFELSNSGHNDVPIVGGTWLGDGDRVTFDAWATGKNGQRIGFGELTAKIYRV